MGINKRAVNEEQKQQRKQHILNTTLELFKASSYDRISMDTIAKKSGVAKGTVFIYFKTKEELFLNLTKEQYIIFFKRINNFLNTYINSGKNLSIEELLNTLGENLSEDNVLFRLIAIHNVVFEKNIEYDTALDFKNMLYKSTLNTGKLLDRCMSLIPGQGIKILIWLYIIVIGAYHVSIPTEIVEKVMSNADMKEFQLDFKEQVLAMLKKLLMSLKIKEQ